MTLRILNIRLDIGVKLYSFIIYTMCAKCQMLRVKLQHKKLKRFVGGFTSMCNYTLGTFRQKMLNNVKFGVWFSSAFINYPRRPSWTELS